MSDPAIVVSEQQALNECPICYAPESDWEGFAKTKCGHTMCMPCLLDWTAANSGAKCPMCRGGLRKTESNTIVQTPIEHEDVEVRTMGQREWIEQEQMVRMMQREQMDQEHMDQIVEEQQMNAEERIASRVRRESFLQEKIREFRTHCLDCSDPECQRNHERKGRWLHRGKLMPCPPRLSSLSKLELGLMLSVRCPPSLKKFRDLTRNFDHYVNPLWSSWRGWGLVKAIEKQMAAKRSFVALRSSTKDSVKLRLGLALSEVFIDIETVKLRPGVKVFKGFTPPKRGARVGDIHQQESAPTYGVCVGYNLWRYSDNSTMVLTGKQWKKSDVQV